MAQSSTMTIDESGVTIFINYHDTTLRIQSVEWSLISGCIGQAWVWDYDIDLITPVYYSGIITGPNSDSESIPGAYYMDDIGGGEYELPSNIFFRFNIETRDI